MSPVPIKRGVLKFFSERGRGKPFNNCMVCSAMTVLRWMGYDVPPEYDDVIREATGVPDYKPNPDGTPNLDKPLGLSFAQLKDGIAELFPAVIDKTLVFGALTDQELFQRLPKQGHRNLRRSPVLVAVNCAKLPKSLRRLVGLSYTGGHAVALGFGTNDADGNISVLYLDPMGRVSKGYAGQIVPYNAFKNALFRNKAGKVKVVYATGKNTAA